MQLSAGTWRGVMLMMSGEGMERGWRGGEGDGEGM